MSNSTRKWCKHNKNIQGIYDRCDLCNPSTQNIPTPKPIYKYKDRVPDFGKELEKDYPPVESNSTQNDCNLDTKNWDSPKEWAIWKIWFSPDKLSDTTTERMRRFAKAVEADARKEVMWEVWDKAVKTQKSVLDLFPDANIKWPSEELALQVLQKNAYNKGIDDVLATLKEEQV